MARNSDTFLAWVESPLQLVAAAEFAATQDRRVSVALRLADRQMTATAEELLKRGARFSACAPYYGIPWQLLSEHRNWAIGDGFSGQFRLASSIITPESLTLLDDGTQIVSLMDSLLGDRGFARPDAKETGLARFLGTLTRDRMLGLAARERLAVVTAFALGDSRLDRLADRGIPVTRQRFSWVRSTARDIRVPGNRVLVGSAWPTDGRMSAERYLRWVADEARDGALAYLPHRRETRAMLDAVRALPGVTVFETGLPIELVLAGARDPLEVLTLPTSAKTTLAHVLDGTGSTIRTRSLASAS